MLEEESEEAELTEDSEETELLLELEAELLLELLLELEEWLELEDCEDSEDAELEDSELDETELEDERSSIDRMDRRSADRGPGNCRLPVWKFSTSVPETSPDVRVSTRVACQIWLSGRTWVVFSALPDSVAEISAAGFEASPARIIRRMVRTREVRPTAGPR